MTRLANALGILAGLFGCQHNLGWPRPDGMQTCWECGKRFPAKVKLESKVRAA